MKILLLALPGALAAATKVAYGPGNCVSLDLSSEGTCVIKTNCPGQDLENFEFAFDCTTPKHDVQRHSFGFGGFDSQEVFDTSVKCTICEPPTDQHHVLVGTGTTSKTKVGSSQVSAKAKDTGKKASDTSKAKKTKSESETKVVKYGPNECVSTYRNPAGHCIMQTNCAKENITDYEFGLICVDKTGEPVRHVFGKDSFDQEESFDTLIACDKCVGLDDIADETSLVKQVESLTTEVEDMNKTLSTLRTNVKKLMKEEFPAPAPASAPAPAEKKDFLLPKISSSTEEAPVAAHRKGAKLHLKTAKRHSAHTRKIQREEDEDTDDDRDEDDAQDEDEDEGQAQDDEQGDADDA